MKRLYLLRHAQAMPAQPGGTDIERPLTPQGTADAAALGREMGRRGFSPDTIFCSEARRTRETLEGLAQSFGASLPQPVFSRKIYETGCEGLLEMIQNAQDTAKALLLVGHNPAIYELAAILGRHAPGSAGGRLAQGYAPGTLTAFDIPAERWADIDPDEARLVTLMSPIDYNAPDRPTRWM